MIVVVVGIISAWPNSRVKLKRLISVRRTTPARHQGAEENVPPIIDSTCSTERRAMDNREGAARQRTAIILPSSARIAAAGGEEDVGFVTGG